MDTFTRVSFWIGIVTAAYATAFFVYVTPMVGPASLVMAGLFFVLAADYATEIVAGEGQGLFSLFRPGCDA